MRYAEIELALDADDCYRRLCDIEAVPRWLDSVGEVRVLERAGDGRVTVARFIAGRGSAGIAYELAYSYDDDQRALRWQIRESTLRQLVGEARVTPLGPDRCRLRYGLHASTLSFRDGALHLEDESPETVAASFRRWAE